MGSMYNYIINMVNNMNNNLKKILLISGIISIFCVLSISSSFAATSKKSETIAKYTYKDTYCDNLEISDFYQIYFGNEKENTDSYYKFNIKKNKLKQYRIKSIVAYYYNNDNETSFTKIYNGNKKQNLTIKEPKDSIYLQDVTINYYSTTSIKSEKGLFSYKDNSWKGECLFKGKTSTMKILEKGYSVVTGQGHQVRTFGKIQIKTKNTKYKIKSVILQSNDGVSDNKYYNKFKGYGKSKLTINLPYSSYKFYPSKIKIYYY